MRKLLVFIFTFVVCFVFTKNVKAETTTYKVTDGFTQDVEHVDGGRVFFYQNISIDYSAGKVILSSNPDGTGSMHIEDMMQLSGSSGTLTYTTYDRLCQNFKREIAPQDITHLMHPGLNNILVRFSTWCAPYTKTIGPVYLVYKKAIVPFLDLPWDYESTG